MKNIQMAEQHVHVQGLRPNSHPKSVSCRCVDGFTVVDWREFLLRTNDVPAELLEKCPWDRFTGFDWAGLLFGKKKLERYCPWETFGKDDWRILLFSTRSTGRNSRSIPG